MGENAKTKLSPYPKKKEQGFPLGAGQNCSSPTIKPQALKKVLGLYRMKKWAGAGESEMQKKN